MEKTMKARVQHKHDIEANWIKATNFTPLASEIIVYDPDENYDYPRIKIGDGKTNINSLPFVTKDYAKISDIPTKPADIGAQPAGNYLTSIPNEYITEDELNTKGYLTSYTETDPTVPAWAKAATKPSYTADEVGALPKSTEIPSNLSDLNEDASHRLVTDTEKATWNAKSNFSGNYDDLTNKPTIPSITGLASTAYVDNAVKNKVDKDGNKVLSTNDYTTEEKNKLAGIAAGAEVNVNADWNATSGDAQILNKPTIPTIDASLSISDQAADAKAVGDALAEKQPKGNYLTSIPSEYVTESELNAKKYLTSYTETDPTVPDWAKAPTKPTYTASDVNADPLGTASSLISAHNSTADAHGDIREALNNKVDSNDLSSAVNDALEQAKVDGKFDGTSVTVKSVSESSADGGSNVVTFSDGKTVTIKNGSKGSTGATGATGPQGIPGEKGEKGDKGDPAAGVELGFAESLEWLKANGDTSKMYVLDGFIYAYMKTTGVGGDAYTNVLPTAIQGSDQPASNWVADGGYAKNMRLSGSSGSASAASNANFVMYATGFIPAKIGDVIRIKNFYSPDGMAGYMISYDTNKNRIANKTWGVTDLSSVYPWRSGDWYTVDGDHTGVTTVTLTEANFGSGVAYIRFSGVLNYNDVPTIVTVNQEIVEGGTSAIVEKWDSTGHAFVPAAYDDEIANLKLVTDTHTAEIEALKKGIGISTEDPLDKIKNWDKPVYDYSPVTLLPTERTKPALTASDRTVAAVYAKYRALMAKHPRYITETNLGKSTASDTFTAVDILRFDFKEPDGLVQSSSYTVNETKPKILLMCGVHCEYAGIYGVYYALEEIAENPEFDDIRRNAHIIVVPCSNPFGLTSQTAIDGWQMSHVNANGVAIHNNFGVEHNTYNADAVVGDLNYGGTEPYSELETQYIDNLMAENSDAIAFVTCHNFNNDLVFGSMAIWASSATAHMCNLAFRLIDKISKAWHSKYGSSLQDGIDAYKNDALPDGETRLGYAQFSTSAGTEQLNATKYGIQATNLEISDNMRVFTNAQFSADVMTHGAEVYANFFRTILAAYDHNDKKLYGA